MSNETPEDNVEETNQGWYKKLEELFGGNTFNFIVGTVIVGVLLIFFETPINNLRTDNFEVPAITRFQICVDPCSDPQQQIDGQVESGKITIENIPSLPANKTVLLKVIEAIDEQGKTYTMDSLHCRWSIPGKEMADTTSCQAHFIPPADKNKLKLGVFFTGNDNTSFKPIPNIVMTFDIQPKETP
ncbi:hypothetical protein QUF63_10630 [Anaerolineales bacterium HSG25]|nr:hypothetical protein [Anaerolineales bacterium HSG25]